MAQSPRLAARCPVCLTTFRVAADQLKLRGGLVRCGKCDTVFDGRDHLLTLPTAAPGAAISPAASGHAPGPDASGTPHHTSAEAVPNTATLPETTAVVFAPETASVDLPIDASLASDDSVPHSADSGRTGTASHIPELAMPAVAGSAVMPGSESDAHDVEMRPADASDDASTMPAIASLLVAQETGAAAGSESESESESASASASEDDTTAAARIDDLHPETAFAASATADTATSPVPGPMRYRPAALGAHRWVFRNEPCALSATVPPQPLPEFVRDAEVRAREARAPTRWLWRGLFTILTLAAVAQAIYWWRGPLAAAYPALRPALLRACATLQCTIPPARHIERLAIDGTQLQKPDETHDHYLLSLNLRSRDTAHVALPALELVLTDLEDHVIARRVLLPAEYLLPPERALLQTGLAPDGELALKVRFQSRQPAVNYRVLMFYP